MPSSNCFVYGCKSGYASTKKHNNEQNRRNPSLFFAPKDADLLEKWRRAIPRKDIILSSSHSQLQRFQQ